MALSIASLIVGAVGTVFGIAGFWSARREKKRARSVRWGELSAAVKAIVLSMRKTFVPNIIYAPTQKSGILLELMQPYFENYIPTIFGLGIAKKTYQEAYASRAVLDSDEYYQFETGKWRAYVPKSIKAYKDKKLLIVDDFAMTGEYLEALKKCLVDTVGFSEENIRTVCLVDTQIAENDGRGPDYVWKTIDSSLIYLPWGRPQ